MLVSAPTAIPRTRKSERDELDEHLTLWVRTGTAHVQVGTDEHRLDAGTAVWLPPGTEHDVWTEPGTVTVPICSSDPLLPVPAGRVAEVGDRVGESLLEHYRRDSWGDLDDLRTAPADGVSGPPAPRFGPAARVAAELSREPASDRGVGEWAGWAACSPSTLRRGFVAQTGLSFAQWRQQCRLARAAQRLVGGVPVGEAAAEVGFASRWGFAGAFREQYGVSPREYARAAVRTAEPVSAAELPGGGPLPDNVMVWIRAGKLRAWFGEGAYAGRAGDVVWLPAGSTIETVPLDCVPLSVLCTDCVRLERPRRVRFARDWHDWLWWASISTTSLLRAEEHHGRQPERERELHRHVLDAFAAQLAVERARSVPMPDDVRARAAATAFLGALGTVHEQSTYEVPADVHASFRDETDMTFASWRAAARMRVARRLLQQGVPSSNVAPRVGFSLVSNFSRAFSRFHGIGPREFQALEGPEDSLLVG